MTRVRVTAPRTAARPAKETREAAQDSEVGQVFVRSLIRSQLRLALVVAAGFLLILGAFPDDFGGTPSPPADAAVGSLAEIEQQHILSVLKDAGGNRDEAARRLGISRKTIDRKCALWNV